MSKENLGNRIEFVYGFSVRVNDETKGQFPIFGSNGITGFIDTFKIKGPGIIIGRKGSVGKVSFSKSNFTPTDTAYYVKIKENLKDDLKFWFYYLRLLGLEKLNTHSSVPGLNRDVAYFISIDVPSKAVQQKIASVLSALDDKIELNNKINAELEAMAKTIYDYWFVQFDFPDKNGKPYKSSGGKMVLNEILKREIPEGWEVGSLDCLGDIVGGSTPSKEVDEYFSTDATPWITPKDLSLNGTNKFITRGELDVTDKGLKAASLKQMPKGSVLLSSRAPIGYLAISSNTVTTNQGFKSFIPNKGFSTAYVYYAIKNALPQIISNASGSTFKEVSGSVLKTISVYLPTKTIVDNYTKKAATIFERQNLLEEENQQLLELRDWLLPMLMNGQISVGKAYEQVEEVLRVAAEEAVEYRK